MEEHADAAFQDDVEQTGHLHCQDWIWWNHWKNRWRN